jgi:integrase
MLGRIELKKITPERVQKFYNDKGREGLASGSVRNIHSVLTNALKNAVRWKLIPQNVCSLVTLPSSKKRKNQVLIKEQIIKLIAVAKEHDMGHSFDPSFI